VPQVVFIERAAEGQDFGEIAGIRPAQQGGQGQFDRDAPPFSDMSRPLLVAR
jgi:hypothetical protein